VARTGRPRSFDPDEVINAAKHVFWRRGTAVPMRDLGSELGVLPGSLHAAFGDKRTLFLHALRRYSADAREAAATLNGTGPVLPRLRALLLEPLEGAVLAPGRGCMLGNTAVTAQPEDTETRVIVAGSFGDLERAIASALGAAQRTGEVTESIDPAAQARLLVALMQGLHVVARAERDPRRLRDAVDAALAPLAGVTHELRPQG
jgi:TetR/AcrR family transcriptional repressor of nem operon